MGINTQDAAFEAGKDIAETDLAYISPYLDPDLQYLITTGKVSGVTNPRVAKIIKNRMQEDPSVRDQITSDIRYSKNDFTYEPSPKEINDEIAFIAANEANRRAFKDRDMDYRNVPGAGGEFDTASTGLFGNAASIENFNLPKDEFGSVSNIAQKMNDYQNVLSQSGCYLL